MADGGNMLLGPMEHKWAAWSDKDQFSHLLLWENTNPNEVNESVVVYICQIKQDPIKYQYALYYHKGLQDPCG